MKTTHFYWACCCHHQILFLFDKVVDHPSVLDSSYLLRSSIYKKDISYIQNLPKEEMVKLISEATWYAYHTTSLFSLADVDRGDVLAMRDPSKEGETWKGKYEAVEHDKTQL